MTLLFLDSFEHYEIGFEGFSGTPTNDVSISAAMEAGNYLDCHLCRRHIQDLPLLIGAGVRTGLRALMFTDERIGQALIDNSWAKRWIGDSVKVIVGFSFFVQSGTNKLTPIFRFWHDDGFDNETLHIDLRRTSQNGLAIYRGSTLLGVSDAEVINLTSLNYIEVKVVFDDDGQGEAVVRVNNCEVINLQNVTTSEGGSPSLLCNVVGPYTTGADLQPANVEKHVYDDFYVCDGLGSVNNDFLGDIQVIDLLPTADGDIIDFGSFHTAPGSPTEEGSPSQDNYLNVNEPGDPDDDVTYNFSNVAGAKDFYEVTDLPPGVLEIFGVQVTGYLRKEIGGDKEFRLKTRVSGVEDENIAKDPDTEYTWHTHVFETQPSGGSWTQATVDDLQIGLEVVEGSP